MDGKSAPTDNANGEFGSGTLAAQTMIKKIANWAKIDKKCWDLKSRQKLFSELYRLEIGKPKYCDSSYNFIEKHGRSLRSIDDGVRGYIDGWNRKFPDDKITELVEPLGTLGIDANANLHLFVNIRINLNLTERVQSLVLRIRYPIYLFPGETIGGLTVKYRMPTLPYGVDAWGAEIAEVAEDDDSSST